MPDPRFIGLDAFQWIAMLAALLTLLLLVDAWAGHYRRGFIHRAQYAPFLSGGLLVTFAVAAVIAPHTGWIEAALRVAGWLATAAGLAGFCLHHYYGIIRKPGGYKLLLNYLMYGAPPLAPLGLSAMGVFALISAKGLAVALTSRAFPSVPPCWPRSSFVCSEPYPGRPAPLPRSVQQPPHVCAVDHASSHRACRHLDDGGTGFRRCQRLSALLWLTLLTGFVGIGMHLRGFDRQMAGLYVPLFNWLQGPPAAAPAVLSGLAAIGLVTMRLL